MLAITYFIVIFGGRQIMKNQDAFKLKPLFILHNFLLTVASGVLLALFIEDLVPILARYGLFIQSATTARGPSVLNCCTISTTS